MYDTMFCQQAAGNSAVDWWRLNGTLYSMSFLAPGQSRHHLLTLHGVQPWLGELCAGTNQLHLQAARPGRAARMKEPATERGS